MKLVDVTLTALQRRNRAAFAGMSGALELRLGESVVLHDERGCYFAGTVVGLDEVEDRYRIRIGVRLPEEYAMLRLNRDHDELDEGLDVCGPAMFNDMQGLLDLMGEAREVREAQRRGRVARPTIDRSGAGLVIPPQRLA